MPVRTKFIRVVLAGAMALALGGAALAAPESHEPANLFLLKQEIRAYVGSGQYERDIAAVAAQASAWLDQRAKQGGGKLAVVFDLDETLLSNWPHIQADDFGYIPERWTAWLAEGKAPAIAPVRDLFLHARRLGLDVIIISGRRERDRPGTEKNLRVIGCGDYALLIVKSDTSAEATGVFKRAQRHRLVAEGHVIIANIGDQASDLDGGDAERAFKLPDPFYLMK